jgi:hypothetical protein
MTLANCLSFYAHGQVVILSETKNLVFQLRAYPGDSSVASLLQNDNEG